MISILSEFRKVSPIFSDCAVFLYIFDEKRKCFLYCLRHFCDHFFCTRCQGNGVSRFHVYILSYLIVYVKYFLPQNRTQCLPTASLPSFRGTCRAATEINFCLKGRMSSFLKSKYHYSFSISAFERPVAFAITSRLICISDKIFAVSRAF